jgi:CRISPR/Cas system-associated exonuclease Cas4 (RecB family)
MDYETLLKGLYVNNIITNNEPTQQPIVNPPAEIIQEQPKPQIQEKQVQPFENVETTLFSVDNFKRTLRQKTAAKNKNYQDYSSTINAYDCFSCIRIPYFRINSIPVNDYSSTFLPVEMRATLGKAVHDFIQEVEGNFTETEVCLKVPELKLSIRLDGLIGSNVLCEIKSCGYSDYEKILKGLTPRNKDFYQTIVYKYLLENYLDIVKQQKPSRSGSVPSLDKYNIQYIQFIYVCHELLTAESNTIGESVEYAKALKRQLESKRNPFWFIKVLTVDLSQHNIQPYMTYIESKIKEINYFLDHKTPPPLDNQYIDKKDCYFCLYNKVCNNY